MATIHKHKTEISAQNDIADMVSDLSANSGASATSLAIIDDWDETNRAAVNTISGQVGVAAGAGAVSASTQRVTLTTEQETILTNIYNSVNPTQAAVVTSISISSTSTTFVNGTGIDLDAYNTISFVPNVTVNAGTNAYYRIQWSFDNTNWFDETIDVAAAIASSESAISQGTMIRSILSSTTGYKPLSAITLTKRARYVRVSQRSDAAVTITTTYAYQLIK